MNAPNPKYARVFRYVSSPPYLRNIRPPLQKFINNTWLAKIIYLPHGILQTTSVNHGGLIKTLLVLCENLTTHPNGKHPLLTKPMFDAKDELVAAVFNSIHGYYRQGVSSLRNAIELGLIALEINYFPKRSLKWDSGKYKGNFKDTREKLSEEAEIKQIEDYLYKNTSENLFMRKNVLQKSNSIRVKALYSTLCKYVHATPGYTLFDAWRSDNPSYSRNAFLKFSELFFETVALLIIFIKLIDREFEMSTHLRLSINERMKTQARITFKAYEYLK